jgi:hypothetical protein
MLDEYYVSLARSVINTAIEKLMAAQSYLSLSAKPEPNILMRRIQRNINGCRAIQDSLECLMEDGQVKRK